MINKLLSGTRCRATKDIRSHQGLTRRFTKGTVQFDLDNLGRHLISVSWDNGVTDYAYPLEIEIIDEEEPEARLKAPIVNDAVSRCSDPDEPVDRGRCDH